MPKSAIHKVGTVSKAARGKAAGPPVFGPSLHNSAQMAFPLRPLCPPPVPQTFLEKSNERFRRYFEGGPPALSDTGRVRAPKQLYGPWETGPLGEHTRRRTKRALALFFFLVLLDRIYENYTNYCDAVFYALSNDEIQRHRAPFVSYLLSRLPGYGEDRNIYAIVERVNRMQAKEFIRSVRVVPYGVLGSQLNDGSKTMLIVANPPDSSTIAVDAVPITALADASVLPGASQTLRRWIAGMLGKESDGVDFSFATVEKASIGDCSTKRYGEHEVIHCIVPDFREGTWTKAGAVTVLAECYANILQHFAAPSCPCDRLRLPILSSGALAGQSLIEDFPNITIEAMIRAFTKLRTAEQETLLMRLKEHTDEDGATSIPRNDKRVDLCVFTEREWPWYDRSRDVLAERIY